MTLLASASEHKSSNSQLISTQCRIGARTRPYNTIQYAILTCGQNMVKYEMLGLAAKYGLSDVRGGLSVIRDSVWSCFVQKVQL